MIGQLGTKLSRLGNIQLGTIPQGIETSLNLSSVINLNQTIIKLKYSAKQLTQNLELEQVLEAINTKGTRNIITLNSQVTYTRGKLIRISNHLTLNDQISRQITYFRSPSNQIVFSDYREIKFNNQIIRKPNVIATKVKKYVTLTAQNQIILLPPPLFGDREGIKAQIKLHKTIGGTLYAYGKRNLSRILNYTFELSRVKGLELRNFIEYSKGSLIIIENWKGEVWYSYIINNPITFTTVSRASPQRELVRVTLEFDGIRLI